MFFGANIQIVSVRVHLPLKQGLRRRQNHASISPFLVRVHLPLKQGLRHTEACDGSFLSASASSIKTRIKTFK